jgi:hypothetical protein
VHGQDRFTSPLNIAQFVLVAFVPTAIISSGLAVLGPGVANALGFADPAAVSIVTWAKWWLMDATGIVITAPVTLLWATTPFSKSSAVEAAAVVVVAGAIGAAAYCPAIGGELSEVLPNRDLLGFLILLPLMWAGLRGNQRDSATAVLVFCGLAAWGLSSGANALPAAETSRAFLLLFALATSTSVASLILGAAIASHGDAMAHLLSAQRLLSIQLDQTQLAFKNAKRHFQLFIEGSPIMRFFYWTRPDALPAGAAPHRRLSVTRWMKSSASTSAFCTGPTSAVPVNRIAQSNWRFRRVSTRWRDGVLGKTARHFT